MADGISELPIEIIHHILSFAHPKDVASFSQASKATFAAVYSDKQSLWRSLYLAFPLDNPLQVAKERLELGLHTNIQPSETLDWQAKVKQVVAAEAYASRSPSSDTDDNKSDEHKSAIATFGLLLSELRPSIIRGSTDIPRSYTAEWLEQFLSNATFMESPPEGLYTTPAQKPNLSQLRVCTNAAFRPFTDKQLRSAGLVERRTTSRAFVYNLRNYSSETQWGPLWTAEEGCLVDWEHVEHLLTVVWMNICEWGAPLPPRGMEAARPFSAPDTIFTKEDWAGVEGSWSRYVCFMDYRDLFAFNFANDGGPRPIGMFRQKGFREATRLLEVRLKLVTQEDYLGFGEGAAKPTAGQNISTSQPILYFTGDSRGLTGSSSCLRGYVFLDTEGTVQWHFVSLDGNIPEWSSFAVQVGGVGSAMGLAGVWTTASHQPGDPVGPFWMWKNDARHSPRPMDRLD